MSLNVTLLTISSFQFYIFFYFFLNLQPPEEKEALLVTEEYQEQMSESTFLFLTLDLPTAPLYKDEKEQLIIPQVPLFNILGKFNGNTEKVLIHSHLRYNMQNKKNGENAMLQCSNLYRKAVVLMKSTFWYSHTSMLPQQRLANALFFSMEKIYVHTLLSFAFRNTKPTKRIFSKGSSWPNCLRTSSFASKDSPRTTSLWKRTPQSSTSLSRKCFSYTVRWNT